MDNIETEYKWAVNSDGDFQKLKAALISCAYPFTLSYPKLSDTYFDTKTGQLSSEKSALRLRKTVLAGKTAYELTLKSASSIQKGLARRREITVPLKPVTRALALKAFKTEAAKLNAKAIGLRRLFSILNSRKVFLVEPPAFKAELCFDNCLIKSGSHKRLLEAELEFKGGDMAAFNKFAVYLSAKSGLKAPVKSKVATARFLLSK